MSIPPSGRPGSTPPSDGKEGGPKRSSKDKKDFRMPSRKEEEAKEEKKKGLFDLAQEQGASRKIESKIGQGSEEMLEEVGKMEGAEATAKVSQITQLIQEKVSSMQIGKIGETTFVTAKLKGDMPKAFVGSNLNLSYENNGLKIHFDGFDPKTNNAQDAQLLVEGNKEALEQMVQALHAKNIQVTELKVGDHMVNLPRVEPLPPPFQPPSAAEAETRQKQEQDQQEPGQDDL